MNADLRAPTPTTAIVVPCHNEAARLDCQAFEAFAHQHDDIYFQFVDDGSTDETLNQLLDLCGRNTRQMSVVSLAVNAGKSEAVRQGILHVRHRHPAYIGYWDADLATPLEATLRFRDVLDRHPQVEVVLGSRIYLAGRRIDRSWARRMLGRLFALVASTAIRVQVHDTQCGAKLFRSHTMLGTLFASKFQSRWIFDVELLARLRTILGRFSQTPLERAVYELPLDQWREVSGSKLKPTDFLRAIRELLSICLRYTVLASPRWQVPTESEIELISFRPSDPSRESVEDDVRQTAA